MDEVTPLEFFLSQNYPNPFKEKTIIKYCVAYKTRVQITVYNHKGKEVEKLVDEEKTPGTYEVEFSALKCHSGESRNLPNGYYYYRMSTEDYSSEKKWLCINNLLRSNTMKNILQNLFFFLLVTQTCFAQPVSPSTSQGGWYQQNSGTDKNLSAVQFIDANNGFVVGDSGIILRTTDAGNNWLIQPSETDLPLNDIFFLDENNGWIAGGYVNTGGGFWTKEIILKTSDGGTTWYKQFEDSVDRPSAIFFNDTLNGWCVGYKIRKTTDGGINWTVILGLSWEDWSDVCFKNLDTGIVAGVHNNEGRGSSPETIRTTDGWNSWYLEFPMDWGWGWLSGICMNSSNSVFVVGHMCKPYPPPAELYGIIAKTTDWGITWTTDSIAGPRFNDVYFIDETNGWIVGVNRILRTTDGGGTWTIQVNEILNAFSDVFFSDVSNGWAVGASGTILHTTNGGVPVELISFTAASNGKEVILNWSTATELNNLGFEIQRSTEGKEFFTVGFVNGHGTTTEHQNYTYPDRNLYNGKYYYRLKQVDFNGTYEYSDVVEVEWRAFNSFLLEQNFPNPFNPTTIIGFGIQNKSDVKITILNAIGEEVAVVLNEEREPGYHTVEFNAANLPSGVYFYQLKTGEFVLTKKMLLLK
jgi:photosystem II stability/assembly factor-like uncharacterized protein/flagellar hook assembly protein FlgD